MTSRKIQILIGLLSSVMLILVLAPVIFEIVRLFPVVAFGFSVVAVLAFGVVTLGVLMWLTIILSTVFWKTALVLVPFAALDGWLFHTLGHSVFPNSGSYFLPCCSSCLPAGPITKGEASPNWRP